MIISTHETTKTAHSTRLGQAGINILDLGRVVRLGAIPSTMTDALDASTAGGQFQYLYTIRHLRNYLSPARGWHHKDPTGLERTIHESGQIAVLVSSGDSYTGDGTKTPRTRNDKGSAMKRKVLDLNRANYFEGFSPEQIEIGANRCSTYILLYFTDKKKSEIRFELSYPLELDRQDRICSWDYRWIGTPIPLTPNDAPAERRIVLGTHESVKADVQIRRIE